ncbi:MAG: hypothetical protein NTZ44_00710 [Candidatus Nomurabacteria bacterium]|nr:hypothetical protein [Candidatus Nomurabacteria bacterium]
MRFFFPIILIGISIGCFFMFLNPFYTEIKNSKTTIASYDEALNNSKALEAQRDILATKYNSIDTENLRKLAVLLPDGVDNIRLILEIENIASPYGMVLKDVKYSTVAPETAVTGQGKSLKSAALVRKDYGNWDLEFSTEGTYQNFLNLLKDLEHNLRIVDISSINFSSDTGGVSLSTASSNTYKFSFKIKTYWLKN